MEVFDVRHPFVAVGIRGSDVWHLVHADGPSLADGSLVTLCARRTQATFEPSSGLLCSSCSTRSKASTDPPPRPGAARVAYRPLPRVGR